MNVEDWLNKVRYMDELVNAKIAEREQLLALATKITPNMDGMPHGSGTSDKVGNIAVKLVDLARETDELIDELIGHKRQVTAALQKLDNVEQLVLYKHYIQGKTITDIADEIGYCRVHTSRIKTKALENLKHVTACC